MLTHGWRLDVLSIVMNCHIKISKLVLNYVTDVVTLRSSILMVIINNLLTFVHKCRCCLSPVLIMNAWVSVYSIVCAWQVLSWHVGKYENNHAICCMQIGPNEYIRNVHLIYNSFIFRYVKLFSNLVRDLQEHSESLSGNCPNNDLQCIINVIMSFIWIKYSTGS